MNPSPGKAETHPNPESPSESGDPTEAFACPVHCGIAGWSYPDWEGYVYPRGVKDHLRFVAEFVDMIEINSTFYRPPDARTAVSWVRRTADLPHFTFTAKLHQDITHRGQLDPALVRSFHDGLAPLRDAGRLLHLLAQFRYDFADTPDGRQHLRKIRDSFADLTHLTLELRHRSWQAPETLAFLDDLGVNVANLDYPQAANSFNLRVSPVGLHAYFRLHGRNTQAWFDRGAGRDQTYNYLYEERELNEIADRARDIARRSKSLTLVANNHYQGKEMANALQIKAMLTGAPVSVPSPLGEHYPQLHSIRRNPPSRLPGF